MDQNTQDAYNEFKAALEAAGAGLPTFLELTMGMIEVGASHIAYALMGHMKDTIEGMPEGGKAPYHELIALTYRRAFCDPVHMAKYGGDASKIAGSDVPGFLRSLALGLTQVAESDNPEQLQMALEVPTDNPH